MPSHALNFTSGLHNRVRLDTDVIVHIVIKSLALLEYNKNDMRMNNSQQHQSNVEESSNMPKFAAMLIFHSTGRQHLTAKPWRLQLFRMLSPSFHVVF